MQKKAILIANSAYLNLKTLDTPRYDVNLVADALQLHGFDTSINENFECKDLFDALSNYKNMCISKGLYILYFAGHGFSHKGINYLAGVDYDLAYNTQGLVKIDDMLVHNGEGFPLVFIDACRKDTKESIIAYENTRGVNKKFHIIAGMTDQSIPPSCLISFSTNFSQNAKDLLPGTNNSPYAYYLSKNINKFGQSITAILSRTRNEVYVATKGKQLPVDISTLPNDVSICRQYPLAKIQFIQRLLPNGYTCAAMKDIPFFVFCREREISIVTMRQGYSTAYRIPTIDQIVATGFEIESGKVDINKKLLNGMPFDEKIESICLDDGYIVIGFSDGSIGIPTPEKVDIFKVSSGPIWDLAFDNDNRFIVCAGRGLSTFSRTTGEIKRISEVDSYTLALDKMNKRIFYTEIHSSGRYLYSSDYFGNKTRLFPDDSIYLNRINYYKMKFINDLDLLVCATSQGVLFLSNDNTWELLSFSADTYVGFHDVASCTNDYDTETRSNDYTCLDVNQDNSAIVLGTTDGKIHIWDVKTKTPITEIVVDALGRSVTSIAWGFDDYFIAIVDYKELISIRNNETINYFFPINDILD